MVSPIVFMIPPPAPWLSMATLQAELKKALDASPRSAPSAPSPPKSAGPSSGHVDLVA